MIVVKPRSRKPLERVMIFVKAVEQLIKQLIIQEQTPLITFSGGASEDGVTKAILIEIDDDQHVLTLSEASKTALYMERAMHAFPEPEIVSVFSDIIMGLRTAVDAMEQERVVTIRRPPAPR